MKYFKNEECNIFINSITDTHTLGSKLLIVAGDSWTNNAYLNENDRWAYKIGKKGNYDYVFNLSTDAGSNSEIYLSLLNFLTNTTNVHHKVINDCIIKEFFKSENIDIIITWSTPIRDKGEMSILYRPYKCATIPDIADKDNLNTKIFRKYYENWFREEHHSYKTQLYTLFLQEYCKHNNLNINFSMAFTCLVEDSFKDTKWDLRKDIVEDNFYGLYGYPGCLQDYLISKTDSNFKEEAPIVEMQHLDNTYKKNNKFYDIFNRLKPYKEKFERRFNKIEGESIEKIFTSDGHPGKKGTELISELYYNLLKK
tara:strand:- start:2384 stop:3316 length:933 start_codon:yes stop_codon:yes gene_type:complete